MSVNLKQGQLEVGQKLMILPGYRPAQAIGLYDNQGKPVGRIFCGSHGSIKLNLAHESQVDVGMVLTKRDDFKSVPVSNKLKVEIDFQPLEGQFVSNGYCCIMHIGTSTRQVILERISCFDPTGQQGQKQLKPQMVSGPGKIWCTLYSQEPLPVQKGQQFVMRDENNNTY